MEGSADLQFSEVQTSEVQSCGDLQDYGVRSSDSLSTNVGSATGQRSSDGTEREKEIASSQTHER